MIDRATIKKNFSRYARYYDRYSTIQNLCGVRLISKIETNGFEKILDVGCGTGNYTKLLREKFPMATIRAIDISPAMIEVAKEKLQGEKIEFIAADGETINLENRFDLISSNATFQWFKDLEKTLLIYRSLLSKRGIILFSTFGPLTFCELDGALKELSEKHAAISSCNFFEKMRLEKILKRLFDDVELERKLYKRKYSSLSEFLKNIKYSGTRGNGTDTKGVWTPKAMYDLEKMYVKKFKNIVATYEVLFCKGVRR